MRLCVGSALNWNEIGDERESGVGQSKLISAVHTHMGVPRHVSHCSRRKVHCVLLGACGRVRMRVRVRDEGEGEGQSQGQGQGQRVRVSEVLYAARRLCPPDLLWG